MKKYNTKKLALSAILTAFITVLISLSAFFPTLSLTIVAIAGLIPAIMVIEYGIGPALMVYAASSVLSFLISPDKSNAILFIIMFGHYPIIKSLFERIGKLWIEWLLKLISANFLFFIIYFLFNSIFQLNITSTKLSIFIILAVYNLTFIIYDLCFSRLITMYRHKFSKYLKW